MDDIRLNKMQSRPSNFTLVFKCSGCLCLLHFSIPPLRKPKYSSKADSDTDDTGTGGGSGNSGIAEGDGGEATSARDGGDANVDKGEFVGESGKQGDVAPS